MVYVLGIFEVNDFLEDYFIKPPDKMLKKEELPWRQAAPRELAVSKKLVYFYVDRCLYVL